jgi:succinoglycan biosynthesis protein ExoL
MKVLFLLQIIGHPRDSKRIKMLQDQGFHVEALAFERPYHKGRRPSCGVTSLGLIENGRYISRIFKMLWALPKIFEASYRSDIVYASGQDVALAGYLAGLGLGRPVVMEVGDIAGIQLSSDFRGSLVRVLDSFVTSRYVLLVVISRGFVNTYYRDWLGVQVPALLIENKLEPTIYAEKPNVDITEDERKGLLGQRRLRIGYFGLLRDRWSWEVLKTLALSYPEKFEIVFAGYAIDPIDIEILVAGHTNMMYLGQYRSPDDLSRLYGCVDMVWACYPEIGPDDWNLRWGRPNRFFESCFFAKPCFVRNGSLVGSDVEKFRIGYVVVDSDIAVLAAKIAQITSGEYLQWRANMLGLPESFFMYSNEGFLLGSSIHRLITVGHAV